jgi:hypothetical protein
MIYGYWNPVPVMVFAVAVSAILFGAVWLIGHLGQGRETWHRQRSSGFYGFAAKTFAALTPPMAGAFWSGLTAVTMVCADKTRRLYTGNGQTYNLYILYYFLALYVAGGGIRVVWPLSD